MAEVPSLETGEILVRATWLSVDPFMRGKLNAGAGLDVGSVMIGGAVGEVVASEHPDWNPGDMVECPDFGWQEYAVVRPDGPGIPGVARVEVRDEPESALSWLGMPGLTAYFAMMEVGRPQPGDTVLISAAAGAVGQIAGQIAKNAGCRVIGVVGDERKAEWCRSVGFDETLNYRTTQDLAGELGQLCPAGIDVFFDGTGGHIHDAALPHLALRARVAIVGKVAVAHLHPSEDRGVRSSAELIRSRASVQGFVVYDWWHRRAEASARLRQWREDGKLLVRHDVLQGFDQVPEAFLRMMRGENQGKQLVSL